MRFVYFMGLTLSLGLPFLSVSVAQGTVRCLELMKKSSASKSEISKEVIQSMRDLNDSEVSQGVLPVHQTQFLIHQQNGKDVVTDTVVLIYHGLLNSPRDMKFLAKDLHEMGVNVVNARLDGHFERKRNELDSITYQDWVAQLEGYLAISRQLGKKVIILGHSTGGLAGVHTAIQNKVDKMVLLAPALKTRFAIDMVTYAGAQLGVSGWVLDALGGLKNDRYSSTYAGVQVDRWGDLLRKIPGEKSTTEGDYGLVQERLEQTPLLWIDTDKDRLIDPSYNQRIAYQMRKVEYYSFSKTSNVAHNSIAVPKLNREYPQMVEMIREFIQAR